MNFIPQDNESTELAPINRGGEHSYETEREILYKILVELRGNVSELKRELNNLRERFEEINPLPITNEFEHKTFSHNNETSLMRTDAHSGHYAYIDAPERHDAATTYDAIAEEIHEPDNLNLSNLGRKMVEKALERNAGNRRKAAQELGISDRTLYRRIKQYGLE